MSKLEIAGGFSSNISVSRPAFCWAAFGSSCPSPRRLPSSSWPLSSLGTTSLRPFKQRGAQAVFDRLKSLCDAQATAPHRLSLLLVQVVLISWEASERTSNQPFQHLSPKSEPSHCWQPVPLPNYDDIPGTDCGHCVLRSFKALRHTSPTTLSCNLPAPWWPDHFAP